MKISSRRIQRLLVRKLMKKDPRVASMLIRRIRALSGDCNDFFASCCNCCDQCCVGGCCDRGIPCTLTLEVTAAGDAGAVGQTINLVYDPDLVLWVGDAPLTYSGTSITVTAQCTDPSPGFQGIINMECVGASQGASPTSIDCSVFSAQFSHTFTDLDEVCAEWDVLTLTYTLTATPCPPACCYGIPDTVNISLASAMCAAANGASGTLTYDSGDDEWAGAVNVGGKSIGFALLCQSPNGCNSFTMTSPFSGSYDCTSAPLGNPSSCSCSSKTLTFAGTTSGTNCCGGSGDINDLIVTVTW